jgi:chorismate mutase / prephenate dehydratase
VDVEKQLEELRARIDTLDDQIRDLISQRAACAQQVGRIKQDSGSDNFYHPGREAKVLRRILEKNSGPLADEEMARLFREIMSACLALESPLSIAFLGPEGTFTQEAALKHFGHSVSTVTLGAIDEVFREVESGAVHFGIVPIENSSEGVVSHTLDSFVGSPLKICGEVEMRIHHHLLGKGKDTSGVKQIMSHQQSLAQCREWLDANMPGIERVTVSSNAEAARQAAKQKNMAAIASDYAAECYDLNILASNIEDQPDNTTRFLIIGRLETMPSGNDKTTLLISGNNRPGLLHKLLMPLAKNEINMTRIESRPSCRGMWEYVFFIDIDGHIKEEKVAKTVAELEKEAALVKHLGSYPKAVL